MFAGRCIQISVNLLCSRGGRDRFFCTKRLATLIKGKQQNLIEFGSLKNITRDCLTKVLNKGNLDYIRI